VSDNVSDSPVENPTSTYSVAVADENGVVDKGSFRAVMGSFLAGVTVITADHADGPVGMAASAFSSLSMDPGLILFCPQKSSSTWAKIDEVGHFAVNILAEEHQQVSQQMASPGDKFAGINWHGESTGSPVLDDALAWIDCVIKDRFDGGDHWIVVGQIKSLGHRDGTPLAYYRGAYGKLA
jgi:3-hydroxy-9,10-secoandrosta-1,3,5(10)-triene-9,17-dione monooxygenase reductase component